MDIELDHLGITTQDLITLVCRSLKELRQSEPLAGNFIPVVYMDELVLVHTIWRVPEDPLMGWMAAIQCDDIVDKFLTGRREETRRTL